ncbi:MAG: EAL domain-containing protein [Lachnospiraceae bacterium]|nr:EAL domain-containing protein [Lachnospiraceae bacterium]
MPLDKEILDALGKLSINYAFQPIFYPDGKTIYAREALMRPTQMTVTELINLYTKDDNLHVLEVATFFGAMQEWELRGYTELISMNSFPSDSFTNEEAQAFTDYYGDKSGSAIIEVLEYPYVSEEACIIKREACKRQNLQIAIDDFGSGISNMDLVDLCDPDIVKLDREFISDIDKDRDKLDHASVLIDRFHSRAMRVIAEGVETRAEFDCLKELRVDYYQGYYLGRPV